MMLKTWALYRPLLLWLCALVASLCAVSLAGCSSVEDIHKQLQAAAYLQEADRQMTLGNLAQGRQWCDKAVALAPNSPETYLGPTDGSDTEGLLPMLDQHGDYPDIVHYLTAAVANPKLSSNGLLYAELADAQEHVGNTTGAQSAYRGEIDAVNSQLTKSGTTMDVGDMANLLTAKADAEWGLGDHAGAQKDYQKAMETYPEQVPNIDNNLAYHEALAKIDLPEALSLAKEAVAAARKSDDDDTIAAYTDTLGWVEHQMGDDKDAVGDLEQATTLMPREGDLAYHLATVYEALGRKQDALVEYQRTVQLSPYNTAAQQALNTLSAASPPPKTATPQTTSQPT